jgi:adenine-specific DNA-methyltransferase
VSNELNALIKRVEGTDSALAGELRKQIEAITKRREFGLVFERHLPESVALANRLIRVGDKVRFIPPRGGGQRRVGCDVDGHQDQRQEGRTGRRTRRPSH